MPKKSKLTLEKQTTLCAIVAVGASTRAAARMIDCSESSVRTAARRDPDFAQRLRQAELQREVIPLKNLQAAGVKYWRASAWLLERQRPDDYGRRNPRAVTPEQMSCIVGTFADIVARGISHPDDRRAVLQETASLCRAIEQMVPFTTPPGAATKATDPEGT